MRLTRRFLVTIALLVLVGSAAALTACSGGPPEGPVAPGTKAGGLGGMEVVGYLVRPDVQRSAWSVLDVEPGPSSVYQPRVLATLQPGSVNQAGIEALEGRYIWAAGRVSSGSGSAKVPEIRVDGIEIAQKP